MRVFRYYGLIGRNILHKIKTPLEFIGKYLKNYFISHLLIRNNKLGPILSYIYLHSNALRYSTGSSAPPTPFPRPLSGPLAWCIPSCFISFDSLSHLLECESLFVLLPNHSASPSLAVATAIYPSSRGPPSPVRGGWEPEMPSYRYKWVPMPTA